MKREDAVAVLRATRSELVEKYGVERIGIFGSVARDEATNDSDVDVVVQMKPDLFMLVHVKELLEEKFDSPVDIVRYREKMNQFLKKRIEEEAVYV